MIFRSNYLQFRKIIEGYCFHTGAKAGDSIDIFLRANPATDI